MSCTVEQRNRLRSAAERCGALPAVAAVDLLAPDTGPQTTWTLEIVVTRPSVPADVLRELALADCALHDVSRQGTHVVVTATA